MLTNLLQKIALLVSENRIILRSLILTQYRRVTERQTDRQTDRNAIANTARSVAARCN